MTESRSVMSWRPTERVWQERITPKPEKNLWGVGYVDYLDYDDISGLYTCQNLPNYML